MVLRDMKKVSFTQVINRSLDSALITAETMFFSLRDCETIDVGLITAVYRRKPEWLQCKYTGAMSFITAWYSPAIQGNGRCQYLHWISPLGLALIKGDKLLEKLLIKLGADVSCVAGFLFKKYSVEEFRECVSLRAL